MGIPSFLAVTFEDTLRVARAKKGRARQQGSILPVEGRAAAAALCTAVEYTCRGKGRPAARRKEGCLHS